MLLTFLWLVASLAFSRTISSKVMKGEDSVVGLTNVGLVNISTSDRVQQPLVFLLL